jgi:hypothetical protein
MLRRTPRGCLKKLKTVAERRPPPASLEHHPARRARPGQPASGAPGLDIAAGNHQGPHGTSHTAPASWRHRMRGRPLSRTTELADCPARLRTAGLDAPLRQAAALVVDAIAGAVGPARARLPGLGLLQQQPNRRSLAAGRRSALHSERLSRSPRQARAGGRPRAIRAGTSHTRGLTGSPSRQRTRAMTSRATPRPGTRSGGVAISHPDPYRM